MKKKILFICLPLFIITLNGCQNEKVLTCTKKATNAQTSIKNTNKVYFKEKKLTRMIMDYEYTLDKNYTNQIANIKKSIDEKFNEYASYKGITYTSQLNEKKRIINYQIKINMKKTDKKTKEKFNLTGNESYSANKKTLEQAGYSCK